MKTLVALAAATVTVLAAGVAWANPFFPGPAYDAVARTGYTDPIFADTANALSGSGVSVGWFVKFEADAYLGIRSVRWTNTGTLAELGNLAGNGPGTPDTRATLANAAGVIAGVSEKFTAEGVSLGLRPVRYAAGSTTPTELAVLGPDPDGVVVTAINAAGTIVGSDSTLTGNRAVRWNAGGTSVVELANLGVATGGYTSSDAVDINAGGTAVGLSDLFVGGETRGTRPVRWNAGGTAAVQLGVLGTDASGWTSGEAAGVNDSGTVIGTVFKFAGDTGLGDRAVRWNANSTAAVELGTLGTTGEGFASSLAVAVNNSGLIAGESAKYVNDNYLGTRAVRWAPGATAATELGNLGTDLDGRAEARVYDMNSVGFVVGLSEGYSAGAYLGERAVAWDDSGLAIDLNKLLPAADTANWRLTQATSISDTNWITGTGTYDPDGPNGPLESYERAFLIKIGYSGDADLNDVVNFNDFLILQANFGNANRTFQQGDFNYDGVVNFNDFLILQSHFGQSLSGQSMPMAADQIAALTAFGQANVPEPATLTALAAAGVILAGRRRRC